MSYTDQTKRLCLDLIHADTEEEVVRLLTEAGYWDDTRYWRHYGDVENNWGQSGNQQSLAEAALAEKIVNSVDARLINECHVRGIDPKSSKAPNSIRAAVAQFFEGGTGEKLATGGYVEDWGNDKIRDVAQGITLCATGERPNLTITVSDCGEGQTPDLLPETILSLNKSNKMYIPFVQGQFNQGGTGALRFCGKQNFQLVVSRRNPCLLPNNHSARDRHWGFTIVRRERPEGGRRNSVYTYLAPVGVSVGHNERKRQVLSFEADKFGIFPGKDGPYDRKAPFGTVVKLYEYQYIGERSNILRGKSLLSRLDLLLPEIALPVRVYEYRSNQKGKFLESGSRETTLLGLRRRLIDNENVEEGFPVSIPFAPQGEQLIAHVFAFKPEGSARDEDADEEDGKQKRRLGGLRGYRKREGIVFIRNGQTHGSLPKDFFRRDGLKMKPLADDLLVFVDCDELSDVVREDLFMPSRDRLTDNDFKGALIDGLEKALRDSDQLKLLRNQRQQERMNERLKDDRPLTEVLQSLIKSSPNLTMLLQLGQRISAPFNTILTGAEDDAQFKGEVYPTFFKIKGVDYGKLYKRGCPINQRMRLTFETDARNDYFTRRIERGQFFLTWIDEEGAQQDASCVGPALRNGIANLTVDLPDELDVGDDVTFIATVRDSRGEFENRILVTVRPEARSRGGGGGGRRSPSEKQGKERERPTEVAPPQIERIFKDDWEQHGFYEFTAMEVEAVGYAGENDSTELYAFKVNMDNTPLLHEVKQKRLDIGLARNQFLYANVLVGLSLLLHNKQTKGQKRESGEDNGSTESVENQISDTCRALAPFLLALTSLGTADLDDGEEIEGLEEVG